MDPTTSNGLVSLLRWGEEPGGRASADPTMLAGDEWTLREVPVIQVSHPMTSICLLPPESTYPCCKSGHSHLPYKSPSRPLSNCRDTHVLCCRGHVVNLRMVSVYPFK